jgi:arsenate reductase
MAEALFRKLAGDRWPVASAGSQPASEVHPLAVEALREVGLNTSGLRPKSLSEIDPNQFGTVITLCAEEFCPVFPHDVQRIHWPLPDPARAAGTPEEQLAAFRQVREELRKRITRWLEESRT